ncbi:MFS transporter [Enterococcus mundtii]|nr:MFS transporter [Enterococcus mundtii]
MERKTNVKVVTICVFIATFMTAIEGTIVTTAMPTIVGSLHGMEMMNWVFSIYLLTNAMLTPIYGKLADKVGRKPIFIFGTLLFIIGSLFVGFLNLCLA